MGTRGAWANDFLKALGNTAPSEDTQKLVAAWTRAENTLAKYNPLATTFSTDTSTKFNSAGVKNYPTREEGIRASVQTLQGNHAGYSELLQGLVTNDPRRALASGGFDTWGSHTSAVGLLYASGDYREEPLKSEASGSISGGTWDDPNNAQLETTPDRNKPENERQSATIGQVTEDDIRTYAKITLGIVCIATGVIVFISGILRTDQAQAALKTVASVTPIGALA